MSITVHLKSTTPYTW